MKYAFILNKCLEAILAASEVASVAPISILMLAINLEYQKAYEKTYNMPVQ